MKKAYFPAVCHYIAALAFFVAAILGFVRDNSLAVVWLCLGSANLCFGSVHLTRIKNKSDKE
ncbi:MAG: hypothetical protein IKL89_07225 [Clostridia bacterium]|nr:hypothetical protein [Clostridia bacterium]